MQNILYIIRFVCCIDDYKCCMILSITAHETL